MLEPAFWKIPSDLSASKKESKILRAQHYRFHIPHYLKDGTRIVPNIDTVFAILLAFDQFGSDECRAFQDFVDAKRKKYELHLVSKTNYGAEVLFGKFTG